MTERLPSAAGRVAEAHPDIWQAYAKLGEACASAGPLDQKTVRLAKLAIAIGVGSEGATHSHARRAFAEGISAEELEQIALLAIPTVGLPRAVAALTWIRDMAEPKG